MSVSYGGDSITFADGSVQSGGWTGMKNRIINGAMMIDQRYAGSGNTLVSATETFVIDRFVGYKDAGVITAGQSSTAPTGFTNSISWSVGTGATATSGQYFFLKQHIEGFNTADLGLGTPSASTFTLSFWVRASVTGTYSGAFSNSAFNRSYPWTYTINSANTWEYKTITVTGDTSGTWIGATNGTGLRVYWDLGAGSSIRSTANTWQTGGYTGVTGTTSISATTGATFYITGVQLERGSTASSFEYRPYGTEFQLCQRYFEVSGATTNTLLYQGYVGSASAIRCPLFYNVTKRAQPTVTVVPSAASWTYSNGSGLFVANAGVDTARMEWNTAGAGMSYVHNASSGTYLTISAEL